LLVSKLIKLFINLIYELIVSGFIRCVSSPTNYGAQFAWDIKTGDVKDSQIIIGHQDPPQFMQAVTARPTFSLFDICICLFQSILILNIIEFLKYYTSLCIIVFDWI